jgi:ribonuclease Y
MSEDPTGSEKDGDDEQVTEERAARLEEKERRLRSQEETVEVRERELDERESDLEEWESTLSERREEILEVREEVERREDEIAERESELSDRKAALGERERELDERAAALDEREAALREYVGDQLSGLEGSLGETVTESVERAVAGIDVDGGDKSRLGLIGSILLALFGLVLVAVGVANGITTQVGGMVRLFGSPTTSFAATGALVVLGLAANLAAAAGRV